MKLLIAPVALMALAGCATTSADGETGSCRNEPAGRFIGQKATPELGWKIQAAANARTLRWVPPRTAVTMEYAFGRVTVSYDDNYAITAVSCS